MRSVERWRRQVHQVSCLDFCVQSDCRATSLRLLATGSPLRLFDQAVIFHFWLFFSLLIIETVLDWTRCIGCAWRWSVHGFQMLNCLTSFGALAALNLTRTLLLFCSCWRSSLKLRALESSALLHNLRFGPSLLLLLVEVTHKVRCSGSQLFAFLVSVWVRLLGGVESIESGLGSNGGEAWLLLVAIRIRWGKPICRFPLHGMSLRSLHLVSMLF